MQLLRAFPRTFVHSSKSSTKNKTSNNTQPTECSSNQNLQSMDYIRNICNYACVTSLVNIIRMFSCKFNKIRASRSEVRATSQDDAILVTGCDSGIGLEIVKHFLETCKFKIICGFLKFEQSEGYKEISKLSTASCYENRLLLAKLDITSSKDIDGVVELVKSSKECGRFVHLVALINNAGTMTYGEFDWLTWEQIENQIDTNLIGTIRLTRAIVPFIIESKGRIINVSSVNDCTVFPGLSVYSATKSALTTFSRGLGYELRKFGAHVVTIRLGDFARLTNIMANHRSKQDNMWLEMDSKKRNLYKDYFKQFNKHLLDNYGMTSPKKFQDSSLFKDFERAILAKNPPTTITCAPLIFKIFYFVIELLPVWVQYQLLDILIQVGFKWKPPRLVQ